MSPIDKEFAERNILMPIFPAIQDMLHRTVWIDKTAGPLNLKEKDINRIFSPRDLLSLTNKSTLPIDGLAVIVWFDAILTLTVDKGLSFPARMELIQSDHLQIIRNAIQWVLITPTTFVRSFKPWLIIAGQQCLGRNFKPVKPFCKILRIAIELRQYGDQFGHTIAQLFPGQSQPRPFDRNSILVTAKDIFQAFFQPGTKLCPRSQSLRLQGET